MWFIEVEQETSVPLLKKILDPPPSRKVEAILEELKRLENHP